MASTCAHGLDGSAAASSFRQSLLARAVRRYRHPRLVNENGHPATLIASHPGNANAARHGLYSKRLLAPRAAEIADALMEAPHVVPADRLAAEEIGSVLAALEAIDRALAEGPRGTGRKMLLEHKARCAAL